MDLVQLLTRRPAASVMDPDYVSETDSSQPLRGLLKALMERTVDVPPAAINATLPGLLARVLTGNKMPVPSEQTPAAQGSGAGYEFGRALPDAVLGALLLANPAASAARRAPANQAGAIKVYHGSPHKFDKASSAHIGGGEGAQAYGHGLYWAESPDVARSYMNSDTRGAPFKALEIGGRRPEMLSGPQGIPTDEAAKNYNRAIMALQEGQSVEKAKKIAQSDDVRALIDKLAPQVAYKDRGQLYEASLRWPDPAREARDPLGPQHFLDWEKTAPEQPQHIQDAFKKIRDKHFQTMPVEGLGTTGRQLVQQLEQELAWAGNGKPQATASMLMNEYGVPGITYLDAGSRAAGAGTRNYVTFSDDLIELLKRNGQPLR